jgi:hypothetical protein
MVQRVPEGFGGLSREGAPRGVGDGAGNHHRPAPAGRLEMLLDGKQRRLGVQGIENGFDQEDVCAAFAEPANRFGVVVDQFVEARIAIAGVIDVGRDRRGARGRSENAGDEARLGRVAGGEFVADGAGKPGTSEVQFMDEVFEVVIGLRNTRRIEGVGLDQIGAGRQVFRMDGPDEFGPGQQQQVVVALEVVRMRCKAAAAVIGLAQRMTLDHRSHRSVEDQDVLFETGGQFGCTVRLHGYLSVSRRFGNGFGKRKPVGAKLDGS